MRPILRRVVSDLPWLLRVQCSLLDVDGRPVGKVNRANMWIRDTYEIRIDETGLDPRMAAATGVAVDALMNRALMNR